MSVTLEQVTEALGITGGYQDQTIQVYFDEVMGFLTDSGCPEAKITAGLMARGVADLWNYGGAEGRLSEYFMQRAAQIALKN